MIADLTPLQVLLVTLAGWINRYQQHVIEYLMEENRVLKGQLTGRRLRLTDDERRRLAAKGRRLGRRILRQVATIVTPDTILRWHRHMIARKWTFTPRRPGRPGIMREISSLIVRMATENPGWGYTPIQGALKNLGHAVARSTVAKVLKANGLPPAPDRPSSWRTFLRAHWGAIAGADFFTTEVATFPRSSSLAASPTVLRSPLISRTSRTTCLPSSSRSSRSPCRSPSTTTWWWPLR
jgi:putative transposase